MAHMEKTALVKDITRQLDGSVGFIITQLERVAVNDVNALRRSLEQHNSRLLVSKKTLLKRVMSSFQAEGIAEFMQGTTGVTTLPEDPAPVAKTMVEFTKGRPEVKICGAVYEGTVMDAATAVTLADMPTKTALRATLLGAMQSPITGLVNVLVGPMRGLVCALTAIKKKQEETAG